MKRAAKVKAKELPVSKLRWRCPMKLFKFRTTANIKPCLDIIGQDRALKAIKMGLELEHRGFNIFVTGLVGTGRTTTIKHLLERLERRRPVPPDICFLNNFKNPNMPKCIMLPAGKGAQLALDMDGLINDLKEKIPAVFKTEFYKDRRKKLSEVIKNKQKRFVSGFETKIGKKGFTLVNLQIGPIIRPEIVPVVDGNPVNFAQLGQLVEEGKFKAEKMEKLKETAEHLSEEMGQIYTKLKALEKELGQKLEKLDADTVHPVIHEMICEIDQRYENEALSHTLAEIEKSIMRKLDLFRSDEDEEKAQQNPLSMGDPGARHDPFREYRVNVVVDNSDTKMPPVIIENFPNLRNIFGVIEREFSPQGVVKADHMNIRAGAFHRANGGYLVLNALDIFVEPGVWQILKRTLKSSEAVIQSYDYWSLIGSSALQPEPMDVRAKIVLIGAARLYYLIQTLDEDFRKIFKIRADFDREIDNKVSVINQYAGFIRSLCDREGLRCFDKSGVAAVVECGVRLAGRQNKLSTQFSEIADIIREAEYHSRTDGDGPVGREHVQSAIKGRVMRANLLEEKIQERIDDGTLMIDTSGSVAGQVNGLSVYNLGDYMFGRPSRITASTALGNSGVINIEREADMSGNTHNKGVLILGGYLRGKYGSEHPLVMSASLCFEQSYGGVDGDSASSTELYAILSSLSGLPLRQDIAVTGSINQKGEIQPIGGVNEKIEGFFKVCKSRGFKGTEGVMIPHQNVADLMLDEEVVEAVKKGKFHIYPIETVDEGIYVLTGVKAGNKLKQGGFTKDSVSDLVQRKLIEMALEWKRFGREEQGEKGKKAGNQSE